MCHKCRTLFYTCQVTERPSRTPSEKIGPDVLHAARDILNAEGLDGFTVRAIALRAGVAPMAIYNHFEGMNGVIEALWVEGFTALREAQSITSPSAADDLLGAAFAYRTFALENPGLYTLMFLHRFRGFQLSIAAAHVAAQTFQEIVAIVERGQSEGIFEDVHPRDAAQVIWSACHGYVSLELLGINFANDREETFGVLLATLQDGFR